MSGLGSRERPSQQKAACSTSVGHSGKHSLQLQYSGAAMSGINKAHLFSNAPVYKAHSVFLLLLGIVS